MFPQPEWIVYCCGEYQPIFAEYRKLKFAKDFRNAVISMILRGNFKMSYICTWNSVRTTLGCCLARFVVLVVTTTTRVFGNFVPPTSALLCRMTFRISCEATVCFWNQFLCWLFRVLQWIFDKCSSVVPSLSYIRLRSPKWFCQSFELTCATVANWRSLFIRKRCRIADFCRSMKR